MQEQTRPRITGSPQYGHWIPIGIYDRLAGQINGPFNLETCRVATPYVALDTNIWRSNFLLRTPLGAALLFMLRQSNGKLVLPEIVEMEVKKLIPKFGLDEAKKISDSFHSIEMLTGSRPRFDLPSEVMLQDAVSERFAELEHFLLRVPTTSSHLQAAFQRVMSDEAPNAPSREQFKDSLIWVGLLEVEGKTREDEYLHFVSSDSDYFEGRKTTNGLAAGLKREVGNNFRMHSDLQSCLKSIREKVTPLDKNKIANEIVEAVRQKVRDYASDFEMDLGEVCSCEIEGFLTEKVDKIAIAFTVNLALIRDNQPSASDDSISVTGEAIYDQQHGQVSRVEINRSHLKWRTVEGVLDQRQILSAVCMSGEKKMIDYRFRQKLDW